MRLNDSGMEAMADGGEVRVLALPGSLRRGSYNRRLLEAMAELAPEGMHVEVGGLDGIPLYDADLDQDGRRPAVVEQLKEAIATADALLIATPEYNHTVPGVLQNAIDWASRPGGRSVLRGKPVGIVGASAGALGTARAQEHLKLVLLATLSAVLPHRGVVVGNAAAKFDAAGTLTDEATRRFLVDYMEELLEWSRRLGVATSQAALVGWAGAGQENWTPKGRD